jgi:hypothetical protein
MKTTYCPYCNNHTYVDDRDWGLTIQCEGPRCGQFFLAGVGAAQRCDAQVVATTPPPRTTSSSRPARVPQQPTAARPPAPESHLTGPHLCQVCKGDIRRSIGRRRATVLHQPDRTLHPELTDNCRTDIYAAIYRCPHCREVLETPSYQWGLVVTCPCCHGDFTAPFDDVLHRHVGDASEGIVFQFSCPACDRRLRCDTLREGRPTRDLPVVCVHCHHLISVPSAGVAVESAFVGQGLHRR